MTFQEMWATTIFYRPLVKNAIIGSTMITIKFQKICTEIDLTDIVVFRLRVNDLRLKRMERNKEGVTDGVKNMAVHPSSSFCLICFSFPLNMQLMEYFTKLKIFHKYICADSPWS